jgi:hypothetical protein
MTASLVRTSAGSTISICAATLPATYDLTGFAALTYTLINEISDLGAFGKKYNLVTFMPLGSRQVIKRRGSYNNGSMSLKMGQSVTDAGQLALATGLASDTSSSFKVVTQSGSTYYFTAQILSTVTTIGTVDVITEQSVDLELDNSVVLGAQIA